MKFSQTKYLSTVILFVLFAACSSDNVEQKTAEEEINLLGDNWIGSAIAYSGYRNGQNPDKNIFPSQEQVLEDLRIIEKNWKIIRTYGADKHTADILEIIKKENINIKVLLGIWLAAEPENIEGNKIQIKKGIEFFNKYKDIIIAVNVGNECQVNWSDHKVPQENLISYINEVKSQITVPVTTADSWDYWLDLESSAEIIQLVDFIAVHVYPIWDKVDIDSAMHVTIDTYERLSSAIPNKKIIITEAGWATYTEGESHVPKAGDEIKQERYFNELIQWSKDNNIIVFWFEAFDEPWKGTGTEGYWGLFTESRKAKKAMHNLYPELITDEPTSPSYK